MRSDQSGRLATCPAVSGEHRSAGAGRGRQRRRLSEPGHRYRATRREPVVGPECALRRRHRRDLGERHLSVACTGEHAQAVGSRGRARAGHRRQHRVAHASQKSRTSQGANLSPGSALGSATTSSTSEIASMVVRLPPDTGRCDAPSTWSRGGAAGFDDLDGVGEHARSGRLPCWWTPGRAWPGRPHRKRAQPRPVVIRWSWPRPTGRCDRSISPERNPAKTMSR